MRKAHQTVSGRADTTFPLGKPRLNVVPRTSAVGTGVKLNRHLGHAKQLVERARNGLEQEVKVRTLDLETANTELSHEIAERRESEESLRKLSRAVEQSPTSIIITDTHGVIEYVNPKFTQITGYAAVEAIGSNPRLLKSGKTSREEYERLWATVSSGQEWQGELCNRKKDGELYWESVTIAPIRNREGAVTHYVAIKEDISERKKAAEAVLKSEERLNAAQRIAHIGSWELDLLTNVLVWSEEIYRIFEIAPEAFGESYEAFLNAIHPEDREKVNAAYTNSLASRIPYAVEHRLLFPGGRIKHVQEQCETYYDADGKPIRSLGTVQDVTELKDAEESVRKSEKYVRDITDSLSEGVYVVNSLGNITFINSAAEALLGWSERELADQNIHDLIHHQKADGTTLLFEECGMRKVIDTGERFSSSEESFMKKDGTIFPVAVHSSPLREAGQVIASVTSFQDISARKQLEAERDKLITDLQTALADIRTLHGIVPICASCKKIRDDEGAWHQLEAYISAHTDARFSHGICKECALKLYPEFFTDDKSDLT